MELRKLVLLDQFQGEWATYFRNHIRHFYLPTEVVVGSPQIVAPYESRAFGTGLYVYKDQIVDYEWLLKLYRTLGEPFPGTSGCGASDLFLTEVWEDHGSDGHIEFRMVGFRFVPEKELNEKTRYPFRYGCCEIPSCMLTT